MSYSQFYSPDSRLPTPDSRLPTPDSRLPTPLLTVKWAQQHRLLLSTICVPNRA
ncbi:MAG: hypothetical protein F6J94_12345 [Moorea sp. SIO1F2]|uniref:hypothetical protein n=1 Tax=unclassified Moorena TaxID=2683338 RepID=UPI0013BB97A6|nr:MULTISPECIES: hypothetical protein [unclassified Moorena]NEO07721.1 hypothetical protein [Moorena sp. SIO3I8]NET82686.1 hypothetical protein [Moorena sp. SIO1F2]